jgi:hypothetical protein
MLCATQTSQSEFLPINILSNSQSLQGEVPSIEDLSDAIDRLKEDQEDATSTSGYIGSRLLPN